MSKQHMGFYAYFEVHNTIMSWFTTTCLQQTTDDVSCLRFLLIDCVMSLYFDNIITVVS